jgi:hypothetical protein
MMFCHLGDAQSLREICNGLAASEGKLKHPGIPNAPSRSTLAYANEHRRKQQNPPERPLPLQVRRKIQKMLWRSGRIGVKTGRVTRENPRTRPALHRPRPNCVQST